MNSRLSNILDPFPITTLAEMDDVRLMDRVDTKYVFSTSGLAPLLEEMHAEYKVLSIQKTRYSRYFNLYFDSAGYDYYLQHHNGKLNRYKVRMREYRSTGDCFLEVKHKSNKGRTVKSRMPIPSVSESFSEPVSLFLHSQISKCPQLLPTLSTSFSRVTLVDTACTERVTLDCELEFQAGNESRSLPGLVIAEVKQQKGDRRSPIRRKLRTQRVRPFRVSKYCLGMLLLNPQLKSNRFKPKLRTLQKLAQAS